MAKNTTSDCDFDVETDVATWSMCDSSSADSAQLLINIAYKFHTPHFDINNNNNNNNKGINNNNNNNIQTMFMSPQEFTRFIWWM